MKTYKVKFLKEVEVEIQAESINDLYRQIEDHEQSEKGYEAKDWWLKEHEESHS